MIMDAETRSWNRGSLPDPTRTVPIWAKKFHQSYPTFLSYLLGQEAENFEEDLHVLYNGGKVVLRPPLMYPVYNHLNALWSETKSQRPTSSFLSLRRFSPPLPKNFRVNKDFVLACCVLKAHSPFKRLSGTRGHT